MFYIFFWTFSLAPIARRSFQLLIFYYALPRVSMTCLRLFLYDLRGWRHCLLCRLLFILFFIPFFLLLDLLSCFIFLSQSGLRRHRSQHYSLCRHRCDIHLVLLQFDFFIFLIIFFILIRLLNFSFSNFLISFFVLLIKRFHSRFFVPRIFYGNWNPLHHPLSLNT